MITPGLEKLILEGKAKYKTYSIGGSGVGTIQCPNSALYIVLTDFIWHPFADVNLSTGDQNLDALTGQLIHTLRLKNSKNTFIYNFRDSFSRENAQAFPYFGGSGKQYSSYILSKEDLFINIFKFTGIKFTSYNVDTIPLTTEESATPLGYGNQPAVRSIQTTAGAVISSMGMFRDPDSIPDGRFNRNEFYDNIDTPAGAGGDTKLIPPNTLGNDSIYGFPLITFGIVEVNKVPDSDLR